MATKNPSQILQYLSILANATDWSQVDSGFIQSQIENPAQAGQRFTAFLKNGVQVMVGESKIMKVDRFQKFDPKFVGKGWKIDEEDERSLALTEIDLTAIRFETALNKGESYVQGEEKLKRLKAGKYVRLDAKVFQTFWENQHLIPEKWKELTNGDTTYICFDGTILRSPSGRRYVLYLYWYDGQWRWDDRWLDYVFDARNPSAVLVSSA